MLWFFSSHFSVFKVRPISWQYVNIEGNPVLYASHAYDVQYKVKVENVFKGQESLAKDGATIFLHSPKNLCLIDQLEMGIKYLISGKFTDISFFINLNCCQVEKKNCWHCLQNGSIISSDTANRKKKAKRKFWKGTKHGIVFILEIEECDFFLVKSRRWKYSIKHDIDLQLHSSNALL